MKKTGKNWKKLDEKAIKKPVKENRKAILIILAIIAVFILVFFGYRLWLNIHFFLTDDLVLILDPQDKSVSIHYEEKPNITINVDIENSFVCNARCNYEFRDISTKTLVDNGTFTSKGAGKGFKKDFQLFVDRIGSGQKLYTFEIQCNNVRTFYCLTDESKRERSVFITLNYDLSEFEKSLKYALKQNITKIADEIAAIDVDIQILNNKVFELGFFVNLNDIEYDKEILNNEHTKTILEMENLKRIWSEENYLLLAELFNRSYDTRIARIKQEIKEIDLKINDTIKKHNSLVDEINNVDEELRMANQTILFLGTESYETLNKHRILLDETRKIKDNINRNLFKSYEALEKEINDVEETFIGFVEETKIIFRNAYINGVYFDAVEKEKLCIIKGICTEKTGFPEAIIASSELDSNKIDNLCLSFDAIKEKHEAENNKFDELLKDDSDNKKDIIEEAKRKKSLLARKIIFEEIKGINANNELNESLNLLLNLSSVNAFDENIDYGNFSEDEILSLVKINLSDDALEYYWSYCGKEKINLSEYYGNKIEANKVKNIAGGTFTSRVEIALTENYPTCCVFGECRRCCTGDECRQDEALYPVLFLHGHALNSDNTPDFSLDAFNKILAKLQEDGYISAGTITPISDYREIKRGEWGLSSRPIVAKGSYYLVSYYNLGSYAIATQKSENIETYAIRLKEIIDLLKFRTGKDKVNIITHSMGGLVARSYLQIFGEEDVYNLIMIAAPNKGISGSMSNYCHILGEKKECQDMNENSIFIKKVNDPNNVPKNVSIHNIVGVGCDMNGKTGDGVVTKENSELLYGKNYFINGTCPGFSNVLHTKILDIDRFEEVYQIIAAALVED